MNNNVGSGRVCSKPELEEIKMKNGDTLYKTRIRVAMDRPGTYGENRKTDFITLTVLGKQAKPCVDYLDKGREVAFTYVIQSGQYEKDGKTVYTTDFVADRVDFDGVSGFNSNSLTGNLTKKPELIELKTASGETLYKTILRLAVNRPGTYGENKKTDFLNIEVLGKQAKACAEQLDKGRRVGVRGHIQSGQYEKDGKTIYTVSIMADDVRFGSGKKDEQNIQADTGFSPADDTGGFDNSPDTFQAAEEDIPF